MSSKGGERERQINSSGVLFIVAVVVGRLFLFLGASCLVELLVEGQKTKIGKETIKKSANMHLMTTTRELDTKIEYKFYLNATGYAPNRSCSSLLSIKVISLWAHDRIGFLPYIGISLQQIIIFADSERVSI